MGAGLEQNHGPTWGPKAWTAMTNESPNRIFSEAAQTTAKKNENQWKRKATEDSKRKRRESKYSCTDNSLAARRAYSRHEGDVLPEDVVDDDVSQKHLQQLKDSYHSNKVEVTKQEMEDIEQNTIEQSNSDLWMMER